MAKKIVRFNHTHLRREEQHSFHDRVMQIVLNTCGKCGKAYDRFEAASIAFDQLLTDKALAPSLSLVELDDIADSAWSSLNLMLRAGIVHPRQSVREAAAKVNDIFSKTANPTMLNYETHVKKGSMFNTPPVLPIYSALQTLKWYKELGGVKKLQEIDEEKARVLYDAIDESKMFVGTVKPESRSIMNVCFVMKPEYAGLEKDFLDFAATKGIVGIKGHRSVGGFRASLYNALPLDSVKVLTQAMKEFENKH